MGSRQEYCHKIIEATKKAVALTLLRRSHSMTTRLRRCFTETCRDRRQGRSGLQARTSMVDGFPYKEEVGGSNPSVPTTFESLRSRSSVG
jgi:hypothetical protein